MARMHTGGRGKSKSRKPEIEAGKTPEWFTGDKKELEKKIEGYAKQNMHPAKIGQILNEEDKVKNLRQVLGARLVTFLNGKGLKNEFPRDLMDLIKKAVKLRDHLSKNTRDVYNKMRLVRVESKIHRLSNYYHAKGSIPQGWKYEPEKAKLLVKGE